MKKRIVILATLVGAVAMLTACGSDKYVTKLGAYKGVEVTVEPKEEVTEEKIQSYIDQALQAKAVYEEADREVQDGDQVNIDYVGKIDGEAFDGGSSSDGGYDLTIGSHALIEGFEEGLLGAKKGDTLDLNLTFPATYSKEELAGKDVVFTVTVNTIKEAVLPELNDEYVAGLKLENVATVDEYREYVKNMLQEQSDYTFNQNVQNAAFDVVYKESEVSGVDEDMVDEYYNQALSQADQYASYYGTDRETFVTQSLGMTLEDFEASAKERAEESAKQELVVNAIAKKEKIKIKKSDITDFAKENMSYYGYDSEDALIQSMGEDQIEKYLRFDKVFKLIGENAQVTEQAGAQEAATEEAATEENTTEEAATEAATETTTEAATEQTATEETTTENTTEAE
ncbi:MAG: trigger factor [Lachnospiraceae bacterium]|nr:trigger factor [Lachnospiraceae bacterium]